MANTTLKDNKGNPLYPQTTIEQVVGLQDTIDNVNEKIDAAISSYTHNQSSASDVWTINHNLNKYPSVSVVDSAGSQVICEVRYIDANNLECKFVGALSGVAYLN